MISNPDFQRTALLVLAILCAAPACPVLADDVETTMRPPTFSSRLDFDLLKETRLFPLFAPSRRPPPIVEAPVEIAPIASVAVSAPMPPTPPALELVGIVETNGEAVALLKDPSSGRTDCVRAGQTIEGWQLSVIGPRMVALAHPEAREQQILRVTFP